LLRIFIASEEAGPGNKLGGISEPRTPSSGKSTGSSMSIFALTESA